MRLSPLRRCLIIFSIFSSPFLVAEEEPQSLKFSNESLKFSEPLPPRCHLSLEGAAILDLSGIKAPSQTLGNLEGSAQSKIDIGSKPLILISTKPTEFAGSITGANGSLTKLGTDTLTLSGINTYLGGTTVSAGTLVLKGSLAAGSGITLEPTGTLDLSPSNAPLVFGIFNAALGSKLILGSKNLTINNYSSNTFGGMISGNGSLSKQGSGRLTLSGPNTYTGTTFIDEGEVYLTGTLSAKTHLFLKATTTFDISEIQSAQTITDLGGEKGSVLNLGSKKLTCGNARSTVFEGVIKGKGGSLTKRGPGKLTLTGQNSYTGGTKIDAGTLSIEKAENIGTGPLTIENGNLETTSSFSTLIPLTLSGSATINTQNNTFEINGLVDGNGCLTKEGSGSLNLKGIVGYTGPTSIDKGTLAIHEGASLNSSSSIFINNDSILDLSNSKIVQKLENLSGDPGSTLNLGENSVHLSSSNASVFKGSIVGHGAIVKEGWETLTLKGTNTYSGTGAIETKADSPFNRPSEGLMNLGTIDRGPTILYVDGNKNTTFGSSLSESRSPQKFSAPSIFTGTTIVTQGTLSLSEKGSLSPFGSIFLAGDTKLDMSGSDIPQTIGSLTGLSTSILELGGTTLTLNVTSDAVFDGVIFGSGGNLIKKGPGKWTLSGKIPYDGKTIVDEGKLEVTGSIKNPVVVNRQGHLTGTGLVQGDVTVLGTLSAKNATSTLQIKGDLTHGNGSILAVPLTPDNAGLIQVDGAVNIDPSARVSLIPQIGKYVKGKIYTLIETTAPLTGQFAAQIINTFPTFKATFLNPTQIVIDFNNFKDLVPFGNPGNVAEYLDTFETLDEENETYSNLLSDLRFFSASELESTFDVLHPAIYKGLVVSHQESSFAVRRIFTHRLEQRYTSCCARQFDPCSTVHLWIDGYGDWIKQDDQGCILGFDTKTGGGALGVDYAISDRIYMGLGGAFTHSNLDWNVASGKANINSYYGSIYFSGFSDYFYTNVVLLGGFNQVNASRKIEFPGMFCKAETKHNAAAFVANLDLGFLFASGCGFEVRPFGQLDYNFIHEDPFTEFGDTCFALKVDSASYSMLRAEIGLNLAQCFTMGCTQWILDAHGSWVGEFRFMGHEYSARFLDTNGAFTVYGHCPDRNLVSPGVGLTGLFYDGNVSFVLRYDGEFGKDFRENNLNIQLFFGF